MTDAIKLRAADVAYAQIYLTGPGYEGVVFGDSPAHALCRALLLAVIS